MPVLIPQSLYEQYKDCYQEHENLWIETLLRCKIFDPCSWRTWYVADYDPTTEEAFWYVDGLDSERWSFSIQELQWYKWPLGIWLERDLYFTPTTLSILLSKERYAN